MSFTESINVINRMIDNFPNEQNTPEALEALEIARDTMERVKAHMTRIKLQKKKE